LIILNNFSVILNHFHLFCSDCSIIFSGSMITITSLVSYRNSLAFYAWKLDGFAFLCWILAPQETSARRQALEGWHGPPRRFRRQARVCHRRRLPRRRSQFPFFSPVDSLKEVVACGSIYDCIIEENLPSYDTGACVKLGLSRLLGAEAALDAVAKASAADSPVAEDGLDDFVTLLRICLQGLRSYLLALIKVEGSSDHQYVHWFKFSPQYMQFSNQFLAFISWF
jgi:hypothetical protein